MAEAIRVHKYGGPEVLKFETIDLGAPAAGQVRIKHHAIGINYIDTYHRSGLYQQPSMPFIPGMEGAGEVTAIGTGVTDLKVGDRVAYAQPIGSYATERLAPAERMIKIPDGIAYNTAAAMMLQGMTVRYLIRKTYKVGPDTTLLWHAAAGGVGLIAMQWLKSIGATVIGTAGGPEKCKLAKEAGATHVIDYKSENFVERVKAITGGKGCDVVYDSIGKDTFPASLDCLKPLGLFITFGNASGPITGVDLGILGAKGSLYATRPSLMAYVAKREDLVETANDLFDVVKKGIVKINVNHTSALKDAAKAHTELEGRKTTGSMILMP
jgi:NADPH2:quinone reductase